MAQEELNRPSATFANYYPPDNIAKALIAYMDAAQQRGEDFINYGQPQQRSTSDVLRPSQYGTPVWGGGPSAEQLHDLPYPGREQPHPIMKAAHAIGQADPMGALSKIMMMLTPKANPFQYGRGANPEEP